MTTKDEDIFCSTLLQLMNAIRLELHNLNDNIELSAKNKEVKNIEHKA